LVANKQFRMDLYYRLNVFPIAVPPLRRRMEDVPILAAHFVRTLSARMSKKISRISSDAVESLIRYSWPGNVRELQNVVERAMILSTGEVLNLPPLPSHEPLHSEPVTLAEADRDHILKALEACNWVISGAFGAAARLGVKRTTLMHKTAGVGSALDSRSCADHRWISRGVIHSASRHSCGGKGCPGAVKYQ
jgi:formate hydrogenlyase transcriptional activator